MTNLGEKWKYMSIQWEYVSQYNEYQSPRYWSRATPEIICISKLPDIMDNTQHNGNGTNTKIVTCHQKTKHI